MKVITGSYCETGPRTEMDSNLGATSLPGDGGVSIQELSDCPGTKGARDFTNLNADIHKTATYSLSYNVTKCGSTQYQTLSGAWIDWNQDQTFADTERLFAFSTAFGYQTHKFIVPDDASLGSTRMRVQVQESASSLDPCVIFGYGGTKDFTVTVSSAPSSGISGGTIMIILLLVFSFVYVALGCAYTRIKLGATGCTRETCLHYEFWLSLPGLCMDGCRWTKGKVTRKQDGDYATMDGGDL